VESVTSAEVSINTFRPLSILHEIMSLVLFLFLASCSTTADQRMRGRGVFVKQIVEKYGEFVHGKLRRHDDIRHRPLFVFCADEEELPPSVGSFCSHHATKHIEQDGFGLLLAHACRLVFLHHAGFKIRS
jgi:hypothetical protein